MKITSNFFVTATFLLTGMQLLLPMRIRMMIMVALPGKF